MDGLLKIGWQSTWNGRMSVFLRCSQYNSLTEYSSSSSLQWLHHSCAFTRWYHSSELMKHTSLALYLHCLTMKDLFFMKISQASFMTCFNFCINGRPWFTYCLCSSKGIPFDTRRGPDWVLDRKDARLNRETGSYFPSDQYQLNGSHSQHQLFDKLLDSNPRRNSAHGRSQNRQNSSQRQRQRSDRKPPEYFNRENGNPTSSNEMQRIWEPVVDLPEQEIEQEQEFRNAEQAWNSGDGKRRERYHNAMQEDANELLGRISEHVKAPKTVLNKTISSSEDPSVIESDTTRREVSHNRLPALQEEQTLSYPLYGKNAENGYSDDQKFRNPPGGLESTSNRSLEINSIDQNGPTSEANVLQKLRTLEPDAFGSIQSLEDFDLKKSSRENLDAMETQLSNLGVPGNLVEVQNALRSLKQEGIWVLIVQVKLTLKSLLERTCHNNFVLWAEAQQLLCVTVT